MNDTFLDLHPEVSMLRGNENNTHSGWRREESKGFITKKSGDSSISRHCTEAKIKVVGVGGGVSNAINRMIESFMSGVEFWVVNTDTQLMKTSHVLPENHL